MFKLSITTIALVATFAASGCDTDHTCPQHEDISTHTTSLVKVPGETVYVEVPGEDIPGETEYVEVEVPHEERPGTTDGLHFGLIECTGTCRINIHREAGASVLRWYMDEGELKNDMATTFDDLIVKDSVSYFSLTHGAAIELELIQPPTDYTEAPVMILESTSAWYTFGYYAWTVDGMKWKDSAFAGIHGNAVGTVFDYTVIN